jgi:hypothetical protein
MHGSLHHSRFLASMHGSLHQCTVPCIRIDVRGVACAIMLQCACAVLLRAGVAVLLCAVCRFALCVTLLCNVDVRRVALEC